MKANLYDIQNIISNCVLQDDKIVLKSDLHNTIGLIKKNYGFDMLKEIIAIDHQKDGIELMYRLYSTENEEDLVISYTLSTSNEAESVTDIFSSAIADEREIYDLFGVNFLNHEDLKRLYMSENWQGNPLRKDYEQNN
ncbi:MAG: NADH-quinone oxidoreductase subunit C [bacterium]|nr:NADH-quinone oxidoreductase subunit C [bacterium]